VYSLCRDVVALSNCRAFRLQKKFLECLHKASSSSSSSGAQSRASRLKRGCRSVAPDFKDARRRQKVECRACHSCAGKATASIVLQTLIQILNHMDCGTFVAQWSVEIEDSAMRNSCNSWFTFGMVYSGLTRTYNKFPSQKYWRVGRSHFIEGT
jgi:hypothetical protein